MPHAQLGTAIPAGVTLPARTAHFLGIGACGQGGAARELPARGRAAARAHLCDLGAIVEVDAAGGPALLPASERFHWLTAPRSDVIQCGRIHSGLAEDPAAELDRLFEAHVGTPLV